MFEFENAIPVNDIDERSDFTLLQPGQYEAMVTESEVKDNKKGTGRYLELKIETSDGVSLKEFINFDNTNKTAEKIAYQTLAEIGRAVGVETLKKPAQLHDKRMIVEVIVEQGKPYTKDGVEKQGHPQNKIKKYHKHGSVKTGANDTAAASPEPVSSTGSTPPWKR